MKASMEGPQKELKNKSTVWTSCITPGYLLKELDSKSTHHGATCTSLFLEALFTIVVMVQTWVPSNRGIGKENVMWDIYTYISEDGMIIEWYYNGCVYQSRRMAGMKCTLQSKELL